MTREPRICSRRSEARLLFHKHIKIHSTVITVRCENTCPYFCKGRKKNIIILSWVAWFKLPWFYTALRDGCRKTALPLQVLRVTFTLHYFKGQDLSGSPSYLTSRRCSNSETVNYPFWPTVSWQENPGFISIRYATG